MERKDLILAAWIEGMQIVGVPRNDWPANKDEFAVMSKSLERIIVKYKLHSIDSMLNAIRRHAEDTAIKNSEKENVYPTFTIGHIHKALELHSSPPYQEKQLKSDGMSEEQRKNEETWKMPFEELAALKVPEFLESIKAGFGYVVTNIIGRNATRPKFRDQLLDKIDINKVKENAQAIFIGRVVSLYGTAGDRAVRDGKTPNEILERVTLYSNASESYVKSIFPDYDLIFIEVSLKQYHEKYLQK